MTRMMLSLLCTVFMGLCAVPAYAQHSDQTRYHDPRTPQGTLRAFAAALTKADLTTAATHIVDAKPSANLPELKQAMQKRRTDYSIQQLRIAENGDISTISFLFRVSQPPRVSSYYAWAVLRQTESGWKIEPARTLETSDNTDPFSSFVSLLSSKRLPSEERGDMGMQAVKLLQLGAVVHTLAADRGKKFALQSSQLRQSLLPYYPTLDVLLRPEVGQKRKVSFNTKLTNVLLKKVRFPLRTVMLYEGENGKLDFRQNGRAAVTLVAGHVRYVDPETAKTLLLWSP